MTETQMLHAVFLRAPAELPDARLFRRNVGLYWTRAAYGEAGRPVKVGVAGQADAYALLRGGTIVEIETKSASGRMRREQLAWQAFCLAWGIPHVVLSALRGETPDQTVTRWIEVLRGIFAAATRTK